MTTSAELKTIRDGLVKVAGTAEWMHGITVALVALLEHAIAVESALELYEEVKEIWSPPPGNR
jgi:hypothetical protein